MTSQITRFLAILVCLINYAPSVFLSTAAAQQTKITPSTAGALARSPAPAAAKPGIAPQTLNAQPALPPAAEMVPGKETDSVVATVNGVKVLRSDIERELRRNGQTLGNEEFTAEKRDRVLHDLITDILVEQFLRENNRMKDVYLEDSLVNARNLALSNYMMLFLARTQKPIQEADIARFVEDHPDFFRDRRAWDYVDISIEKSSELDMNKIRTFVDYMNKKLKGQKKDQAQTENQEPERKEQIIDDFTKITDMVTGKKLLYIDFRGLKNSEEIDNAVLAKLKMLKPGEAVIEEESNPKFIHIIKLNTSFPSAVDPAKMRTGIIQGMLLERATDTMKQIMDQMRANVDIKIVNDLSRNRVAEMKQSMANIKENANTKVTSEYEKTQQVIKEMQEMANKRVLAEAQRRRNRAMNPATMDKPEVDTPATSKKSLSDNLRLVKNIWILSMPILFLAAFYQFLRKSNSQLQALTTRAAKDPQFEVESKLERIVHNPILTWSIGILLAFFLGKTGWTLFHEMNLYTVRRTILEWSAIALVSSVALVWLISKIYNYLPTILREWRFMFLALITMIQIGIIAAG